MKAYQYNSNTRQLELINLDHHKEKVKHDPHFRNMSRKDIDEFMIKNSGGVYHE